MSTWPPGRYGKSNTTSNTYNGLVVLVEYSQALSIYDTLRRPQRIIHSIHPAAYKLTSPHRLFNLCGDLVVYGL